MSAALVRRGLELFRDDTNDVTNGKKRKTPSSSTVMELVSSNRQGVTKQVKRLQGRLGPGKSKATVKDKRIKSAVEEFRKKQGQSLMNENLKYFVDTGCKAPTANTLKILSHSSGRQSRNRPEKPTEKPKKPQSLFTEEDFQKFQKEYFGKTVEEKK